MNNIQFENQYEITKKLVKSWNKLSQKRSAKHRIWMNFLAKIGIVVLATLTLLSICFSGSQLSVLLFSLLMLLFIFYLVGPAITFKVQSKRFSQVTGEAKWIQTICFGENIEIKNGNTTTTYSYYKIRFIDENDECFYLFISIGLRLSIFHIYKNSFSVGNADEFSAFIKEQCTKQEPFWTKRELNKRVRKKLRPLIALWIAFAVIVSLFVILEVNTVSDEVRIGNEVYRTSLTNLDLSGKSLNDSDIEKLRQMRNLISLDLTNNQISDISALEELTNLTWLSLRSNQISDISALRGLNNLTILELASNQISDISPLKDLTNLTWLSLALTQISDISALEGLINLSELYLGLNQINDISALKNLTNLAELRLHSNQISDISALRGLIHLTELDLRNNQISDIGVLKELTHLTELILWGNQIRETQLEELASELPNCRILP